MKTSVCKNSWPTEVTRFDLITLNIDFITNSPDNTRINKGFSVISQSNIQKNRYTVFKSHAILDLIVVEEIIIVQSCLKLSFSLKDFRVRHKYLLYCLVYLYLLVLVALFSWSAHLYDLAIMPNWCKYRVSEKELPCFEELLFIQKLTN